MYKENFHIRIKRARLETGYTQKQVSDLTGINRSSITKYELGQLEPDMEKLGIIAQFYNVSINWLLGVSIEPEIKPIKKSNPIQRNNAI